MTSRSSNPDWLDLFDAGCIDHVVELLRVDLAAQRMDGYQPHLHQPLREILQAQINGYIVDSKGIRSNGRLNLNRTDIEAAYDLLLFVGELAERIEAANIAPEDPDKLKQRWDAFVARAAGPRMYHDIPKKSADTRKAGKESGKTRRQQRKDDLDAAAAALNSLRKKNQIKHYTLKDIKRKLDRQAEKIDLPESSISLDRLSRLTLKKIRQRAAELNAQ